MRAGDRTHVGTAQYHRGHASEGRLTKERFYTNTKVGKRLRQHFIEDIDSITMLAVIREQETGIPAGPLTNEINVIGLEQSTEHPPLEVMEHIARTRDELTRHRSRILFVCMNGSMTKFAVFRNANVAEGLTEARSIWENRWNANPHASV